tara:strand:- start:6854 stop:7933 length:1080 start_codon:yes stop_codon:yes gene_type:complete
MFMPKKIYFKTNYAEAINNALEIAMRNDKNVICYGLGVTDPKGVFGTTIGLEKKFGKNRVFDVPTSENALTGIGIGASLNNLKCVMTHQRVDFFLLAMDQLVNNAAKWYYMYGGKKSVPITIRLIIGRGWGQGPTHSQNLQSWFAHIPGLKVVMPSNPYDAKGMLLSSINDPNPVIFLENRWLHYTKASIPKKKYFVPINKSKVVSKGKDITIVSMSYLTPETLIAKRYLKKININPEIIDLRSIKPLDLPTIIKSIKKTKNLLVLDTGFKFCSVSSEIITSVLEKDHKILKNRPGRLTMPDIPEPTSFGLTKHIYLTHLEITKKVLDVLKINKKKLKKLNISKPKLHDVPNEDFKGPF